MSRKVDLTSGSGMSGEVASNQINRKPQQQERTGGVPGGVKKSVLVHVHLLAFMKQTFCVKGVVVQKKHILSCFS